MFVEQAVFTSARTDRFDGYQLVAASPGLSADTARRLARWGPTHESLLPAAARDGSVCFFPLDDGKFCIGKTTGAGSEYSGRGGRRIYTQYLVVTSEHLARFANDPFRLIEAAVAAGRLVVLDEVPPTLESFPLTGRASAVDRPLLAELACRPGPRSMAALVQAALAGNPLGVCSPCPADRLFAGMLNLLPPSCRTEFSFSTGLRYSPRRPFRWISLPSDRAEQRRTVRRSGLAIFDLAREVSADWAPEHGWAAFVWEMLAEGRIDALAELLAKPQPGLHIEDLNELADRFRPCLEGSLEASTPGNDATCAVDAAGSPQADAASSQRNDVKRAHAPHRRFEKTITAEPAGDVRRPGPAASGKLDLECGWMMDTLEELDDAVFAAVDGEPAALEQLESLWLEVTGRLDPELVEESREAYLHHALARWLESAEGGTHGRDPSRAVVLLDVLSLLFGDA